MEIKFDGMEYEEAIEFLKSKIDMSDDEFHKLHDYYKRHAFTVGGYSKLTIVKKIKETLITAIERGITANTFKETINNYLADHGYSIINNYQIDNIFRTNIQSAYQVGHYKQMNNPTVKKFRPYWMYDAVNDSRTRPTHLAMNGKVYPAEHEIWDTWYPPNGFRCRCTVRTLSAREVERLGLSIESELPHYGFRENGEMIPISPDKNFDSNIAENGFNPSLEEYPNELVDAFKRMTSK